MSECVNVEGGREGRGETRTNTQRSVCIVAPTGYCEKCVFVQYVSGHKHPVWHGQSNLDSSRFESQRRKKKKRWPLICSFQIKFWVDTAQRVCAVTTGRLQWLREIKAPGTAGFRRPTRVTEPKVPRSAWARFGWRLPPAPEVSEAVTGPPQAEEVKSLVSEATCSGSAASSKTDNWRWDVNGKDVCFERRWVSA